MADLNLKELVTYRAQFGKRSRYSHPGMNEYIYKTGYGSRIKFIDLEKTLQQIKVMSKALKIVIDDNKKVLFVDTRPRTSVFLRELVSKTEHFYICERWWGGTLTNWQTIQSRIGYLKSLLKQAEDKEFLVNATKREIGQFQKKKNNLFRNLEGIMKMEQIPDALFLVHPSTDKTALQEANQLNIPVFALSNTDSNPVNFKHFVLINNNSDRVVQLILHHLFKKLFPNLDLTDFETNFFKKESNEGGYEKKPFDHSKITYKNESISKNLTKTQTNPILIEKTQVVKPKPILIKEPIIEPKSVPNVTNSEVREFQIDLKLLKKLRTETLSSWATCKTALIKKQNNYDQAFRWLKEQHQVVIDPNRVNNQGMTATFLNVDQTQAIICTLKSETDFVARNPHFQTAFLKLGKILSAESKLTLALVAKLSKSVIQELINQFKENIVLEVPSILTCHDQQFFAFYNHTNYHQTALLLLEGKPLNRSESEKLAMHVVAMKPQFIASADVKPSLIIELTKKFELEVAKKLADRPVEMQKTIVVNKLKKHIQERALLEQAFVHQTDQKVNAWLIDNKIKVLQMFSIEQGS